jgi:glutathione synthase/RimK-type ligase-like ATP-grasp enzyme
LICDDRSRRIYPGAFTHQENALKVIVFAYAKENHTAPVKWALEQAGYQLACWGGLSWREEQQASLLLDLETKMALGPYSIEPGDAIWIRRPDQPTHNPKVSEADRKFAELEYRSFYHCIAYTLETLPVWCINKFSAARFIHNKAVQLHLARTCGLRIPRTLMSNSPGRIREFFSHNGNQKVGKGFTPHVWQRGEQEGVSVTETFALTPERLPSDEVLTYAPGIYQDMVAKQYDIRMVLMGHRLYSFALHNPKKALDWRQDAGQGNVTVEIVPTPPEVERGVLAFARKAGICFGSIDFAVDTDGQWWFLEINEQGQFLWLDQFNAQARTLEKFCAFITQPEGSTQPLEGREGLFPAFADYIKVYRSMPENQEPIDIAAAVAASPFMSRESGRFG